MKIVHLTVVNKSTKKPDKCAASIKHKQYHKDNPHYAINEQVSVHKMDVFV